MTPVEVARSQVGTAEPEAWSRYCDGDRLPWCAAFLLWCWRMSQHPDLPGNRWTNRAVWRLQRQLERSGARLHRPLAVGDIVVMTRPGSVTDGPMLSHGSVGHIGIVDDLDISHVRLIEGNVGDRVVRVTYAMPPQSWLAIYRWPLELAVA